jgi:putative phage integrase
VVKIIRDLNAEGHVGRKRPWGETITKYLLKNETYLGKSKYKGKVYEGQHEAIISQELFDLVQLEVERRQISALEKYNNPRPFRAKYMLSGLMKCGYCGASLGLRYTRKDKNGISHHKYQCRNRHSKDLEKRCESGWYSKEELERDLIKELERIKFDPKYKNETLAKKEETIKVEEIKKQLERINNQVSKLTELYLDEIITRKELDEKNAKIKTERQYLEEQLENQKSNVLSIRKRKLTRLLKDFDVEKLSYEDASKIVKNVIKEIIVTKDGMSITLDF